MMESGFYNMDCVAAMKEFPNKFFDIAIVDPPYGDGGKDIGGGKRFGQRFDRYKENGEDITWDIAPDEDYFKELFRVSRDQIIWGGQLFSATTNTEFYSLEKTNNKRNVFNGYGRICVVQY